MRELTVLPGRRPAEVEETAPGLADVGGIVSEVRRAARPNAPACGSGTGSSPSTASCRAT
jgi:hypothetical protein